MDPKANVLWMHRKYRTGAPDSRKHTRGVYKSQMSRTFATAEEVI